MTEARDYSLRHLPAHLAAAGLDARLYELARNREFADAQAARFTAEPRVSLSAQRAALTTAAANDDAVAVAEFTLRHVARLVALSSESPLAVLRAGALSRAWQLADVPDSDDRALWYLLLAWDLATRGDAQASEATLIRLLDKCPTQIPPGRYLDQQNWKNAYARLFLDHLANPATEVVEALAARLLPDYQCRDVLLHQGDSSVTHKRVKADGWVANEKEAAFTRDGLRLALAGDVHGARTMLNQIGLDGYSFRSDAYFEVIGSLISADHASTAIALAAEGLRPVAEAEQLVAHRARALARLAEDLTGTSGLTLLDDGVRDAAAITDDHLRFAACEALACAGLKLAGRADYEDRITAVMDDDGARAEIGPSACRVLTEAGHLGAALDLAAGLPNPFWFKNFTNQGYVVISRVLSARGDLRAAEEVAARVELANWEATVEGVSLAARADALAGLVGAALRAGETHKAEHLYHEILAKGSGTEGAVDEWHQWVHEAFSELLLHHLEKGRSDRLPSADHLVSGADLERIARAADSIAAGQRTSAGDELARIADPVWRARALCRLARSAERAELLRLAALALDCVRDVDHAGSRLELLREISELVSPLDDARSAAHITAVYNEICAELTGDLRRTLPSALSTALRHWRPAQLQGALGEAAEWPSAAYEVCVVLARRQPDAVAPIVELARTVGDHAVGGHDALPAAATDSHRRTPGSAAVASKPGHVNRLLGTIRRRLRMP